MSQMVVIEMKLLPFDSFGPNYHEANENKTLDILLRNLGEAIISKDYKEGTFACQGQ